MKTVFLLLVIYQIKHFLADYPLQGKYMLGKFKKSPDYILPLLAHVGVHGAFTLVIATAFHSGFAPWGLAIIDMVLHFIMDRIKASPDLLGRYQAITKADFYANYEKMAKLEAKFNRSSDHEEKCALQEEFEDSKNSWAVTMRSNVLFWWSLGLDQM